MPEFLKDTAVAPLLIVVNAGLGALLAAPIIAAWAH